jgi:hypothetical protein
MVNKMAKKLVYGIGINDADYVYQGGRTSSVRCNFYTVWSDMLRRCYSASYKEKHPTYADCYACEDWKLFSNFKAWMKSQDYQGKQLDKDLLFVGNKIYSPDTCVFVDAMTNKFTVDSAGIRGEWPIGVYFDMKENKFIAGCCNPITKKKERLGSFNSPAQAHLAWKTKKHEHALKLADMQTDQRVAEALRARYL